MRRRNLLAALPAAALARAAGDWPQFRGPDGQGHAAGAVKGLPTEWSDTKNVAWKVAVPGKGWSSPVIAGGQIWFTTATDTAAGGRTLRLLSYDEATGKPGRNVALFELESMPGQHKKNSYASPTPVLEGDIVYTFFGHLGTAAVRASTGEIVWKAELPPFQHVHGNGGSPVLWRDLMILMCDGTDVQYVIALDKATGKTRWKQERPRGNMSFSTPLIVDVPDGGGTQLIAPSAHRTIAYEPATGKPLWWVEYGDGFSNVPRPVYAHGFVYLCTGFYKPELLAVRPPKDAAGNVTATHITWRAQRGVPLTPSPVVVGNEIYYVSDNGILSCLDARDGKQHYQERLGGNFSASPLAAGGHIYWPSEEGVTTVIAPGTTLQKAAENTVDAPIFASLAVSDHALILRSSTHLYRISSSSR